MEGLLGSLSSPAVIVVIIVLLLLLIAVPVLLRRRRSTVDEEPPELGSPIDYTSLPIEEQPTWRERVANLSLAGKILLGVVPLLLLVAVVLMLLLLAPGNNTAEGPPPTPTPIEIVVTDAIVASVDPRQRIQVEADSTLPEDTVVAAELFLGEEPFPWYSTDTATTTVRMGGEIQMALVKADDAPTPSRDTPLELVLTADYNDEEIVSDRFEVSVPDIYARQFFAGQPAAAAPTDEPAPEPTESPEQPTDPPPEPTDIPEPEPTAPPDFVVTTGLSATVGNGGNVRQHPLIIDNVIGVINPEETIEIIGRTPNSEWYLIRNQRNNIGWVSVTLISVDPAVAEQVPVESVVTVFVSGNVFEQPQEQGGPVDQVFVGETVDLLQKTADGAWYEVTTVRDATGWVSAGLLGIPDDIAEQVPSQEAEEITSPENEEVTSSSESVATAENETTANTRLQPIGITARVFNRGSVRDQPSQEGTPLGEIQAGEEVELLQRTADATWYQIETSDGLIGWVSASLLRVAPSSRDQVPIFEE